MIAELSDDDNARILVDQLGMSEERARFIIALERGRIDGDTEVIDGPLSAAERQRIGIGGIFDTPPAGQSGDPRQTEPATDSQRRSLWTSLLRAARGLLRRETA